ncbi:MMPL family transporter [Streptomyces liangshanensis]|uniref:MMPL family transporter n=1 Tax=Streptomyces liangshanensis TaxID=2717324 RepID=A0A6G9H219_9ACTN|nr:MMPL family transporter [Streptomyces liangshanensis]QIQ04366.1 MMPL family transporter [Streptomyces liangshanensis]
MATFLYKLGRLAFRRRWRVLLTWLALLAIAAIAAFSASAPTSSSFSIPGTEAQRAFDLLDQRFPGSSSDGATARVVFKAPAGEKITEAGNKAEVKKIADEIRAGSSQVESVNDPYTSGGVARNGTTAYLSVSYKVGSEALTDATRTALEEAGADAKSQGMAVEIGGDALQVAPETGSGEIVGVAIAAVVLVITFGSLIAAGLPLLTALLGVGVGISGITALATVLDLGSTTSILAMMIGLAVGIDYALFIVSRYRAELAEGREREEAAGRAVGTAGSAVVFAGLTVVIALSGLAVVNLPMLTKMGLAAAATVVIAVLIALTLTPAMLGFVGKRVFGRKARAAMANADAQALAGVRTPEAKPNMGTRWARFVLRRPVAVLLVGVLGLGAVAVPAASLELGLPDDGSQPVSTTQRKAYDLLSDGFGPGFNGPLMLVVDGQADNNAKAAALGISATVKKMDDVVTVLDPVLNKAGDTATVTVIPKDRPSSVRTEELVHDIRSAASKARAENGAEVYVSGATAMNIDFSQRMNDALLPYLALVVGLAFLLLMLVFRSVLVPLKAALGFLLSVVAALGAVVAVFQWGWLGGLLGVEQTGPIMSMMPIFMVGVVFGLAMDYEVFLVTRMREAYVHGERPGEAIVTGFRHGARVVSAAAVIMIAVFAGFIGASDAMIKMIGFGLAVAVFFDAFVVRMAVVPAVMALLGRRAWWLPRWLDRALPNVDVEGEQLRKRLGDDAEGTGDFRGPDGGPGSERELVRV